MKESLNLEAGETEDEDTILTFYHNQNGTSEYIIN